MADAQLKTILENMTLEEKVGQLLMAGFFGREPSPEIRRLILERKVGSVVLFARNLGDLAEIRQLTGDLQELARLSGQPLPLIIATDQEGGVVTRVFQGTIAPGNMALAATKNPASAYRSGEILAREMAWAGINLALAPVLDLSLEPENASMGVRCYSDDPQVVAAFGREHLRGLEENGVGAAVKHFPGIGSGLADSHLELSTVAKSKRQLWEEDLLPFREALKLEPAAVMLGHVHYSAFNAEIWPSSLSPEVVTDLLINTLNYQGIIMTDDLNMRAVSATHSIGEIAELAVQAGVDLLVLSHYYDKQNAILDSLLEAAAAGRISRERLDRSVLKILRFKAECAGWKRPGSLDLKAHAMAAYQIALDAITHWQRAENTRPLDPQKPVIVITPHGADLSKVEEEMPHITNVGQFLQEYGLEVQTVHYSVNPGPDDLEAIQQAISPEKQIVLCTYNLHLYQSQERLVRQLKLSAPQHKVAAIRNPYDLPRLAQIFPTLDIYATYGFAPVLMRALAAVLLGHHPAHGEVPVSI